VRTLDETTARLGGDVRDATRDSRDRATPRASDLRDRLAALALKHGILDVYVFGSRAAEIAEQARGGAGSVGPSDEPARAGEPDESTESGESSRSDVDIGVRPRRDVRFDVDERVDLTHALEDLFGVSRVDLVVLPEAGAFLAEAAIAGELLFCGDATDQAEYELYVLRRAGDLLPFERERRELILKHGAR